MVTLRLFLNEQNILVIHDYNLFISIFKLESVNHEGKQDHIKEQRNDDEHPAGKPVRDQERNEADWLKEVNLEQLCKEVCMFIT
jgi:hypothetical protein